MPPPVEGVPVVPGVRVAAGIWQQVAKRRAELRRGIQRAGIQRTCIEWINIGRAGVERTVDEGADGAAVEGV